MPFSIRLHHPFPEHCAVTYKASPTLKISFASTLLVLNSVPASAEWVAVEGNDEPGIAMALTVGGVVAKVSPIPHPRLRPRSVLPRGCIPGVLTPTVRS